MEVDRESLKAKYRWMPREELLELHAAGTLPEEAYDVLESELSERGVTIPPRPKGQESPTRKPVTALSPPVILKGRRALRTIAAFEVVSGGLRLASILSFILVKFPRLQISIFDIPLAVLDILGGILLWKLHPRGLIISLLVQAAYAVKFYLPQFAYAPNHPISMSYSLSRGGYGFGIDFVALILFGYLLHTLLKLRETKA